MTAHATRPAPRRLGAEASTSRTVADVGEFARTLSTHFLVPLDDLGPDGVAHLWHKTGTQDDLWRARVGKTP
ncbi:hypothetical protein ACQEUX_22210 [Micromonospora sp. CA-259024]|uniref:hypothetical protein n=1 Tax=Micromonospora sp. CA-259024 TaxID=3239965 RepID=UPI003D8DF5E0